MKESDFIFDHIQGSRQHGGYWFKVIGKTKEELTKRYMEQSMIEVTEAVFYLDDGEFGVRRLFPLNYDIVLNPSDKELQDTLQQLTVKTYREQSMKD